MEGQHIQVPGAGAEAAGLDAGLRKQASLQTTVRRIARRHPTMVGALVMILLITLMAILAPFLFTADPKRADPLFRLLPPQSEYWFGTDRLGRDVYTRTIYGSRISLLVGVSVALIVAAAASLIGLLAGYFRLFDMIIMRVMDGMMSIPTVLLAIALVSITGSSVQNVIMALSVASAPRGVRVVRSAVLSLAQEQYVEAAKAVGARTPRILSRHIFPGVIAPLTVLASIILANSILVEAILSFLGAGTPTEIPSWGNMMAEGRTNLSGAIWGVAFPGLFLTITVLAFNVLGDNLRDLLDPRLSRSE